MKELLLIDGNAVLHRAYYALPDWRNRSGEATAGVYGFLSVLLKTIDDIKPTHVTVVFDCPEPTFRHTMYVGYQTNREKDRQISEDIWGQVEKLKIVFEKMGIPVYAVAGFEADDVIGTISAQAESAFEVKIITGDRDLMQLVTEHTKLLMPIKGITDMAVIDRDKVRERLGIWPEQVVDYKGLVGDSSDNYPGIAGIGPKTAIQLLEEHGTLESIYKNIEQIGDKVKAKLANGYDAAMLSQTLATIRRDVPITWDGEKALIPGEEKIVGVLKELGHKSLIRRVTGEIAVLDDKQGKLFE